MEEGLEEYVVLKKERKLSGRKLLYLWRCKRSQESPEVASSRVLGTLQAGRLVNSPEPLACVSENHQGAGHKVIRFSI
jgi:hypothetical protein